MSKFLNKLRVELLDDYHDTLIDPLIYLSDIAGIIRVPAGFVTDYASVPRLPIAYALFGNCSREAAVIHDWLYTARPVDRATADAVLKEAAEVTGVSWWRRWGMWAGVRIGGGSHWETKAAAQEEPTIFAP